MELCRLWEVGAVAQRCQSGECKDWMGTFSAGCTVQANRYSKRRYKIIIRCQLTCVVQVPAVAMNEAKRNYYTQDLHDWCQYAGVKLQFPSTFPLRTVLPLRATLASNCDPTIIRTLCMWLLIIHNLYVLIADRAAWQDNLNIGEKDVYQYS